MPDPRLTQPTDYLAATTHITSQEDFWEGWDAIEGDLAQLAWDEDADPELRESYTDLLVSADDGGWMVPDEHTQP